MLRHSSINRFIACVAALVVSVPATLAVFTIGTGGSYATAIKKTVFPYLFPLSQVEGTQFKSSYLFYRVWLKIFGTSILNPYVLFLHQLCLTLLSLYALYLIGKKVGDDNPHSGWLLISFVIVASEPVMGIDLGISYPHGLAPAPLANVFLLYALWSILSGRVAAWGILIGIAMAIHVRNSLPFFVITTPVLWFLGFGRPWKEKLRNAVPLVIPIIVLLTNLTVARPVTGSMMDWVRAGDSVQAAYRLAMMANEGIEGVVSKIQPHDYFVLTVLLTAGIASYVCMPRSKPRIAAAIIVASTPLALLAGAIFEELSKKPGWAEMSSIGFTRAFIFTSIMSMALMAALVARVLESETLRTGFAAWLVWILLFLFLHFVFSARFSWPMIAGIAAASAIGFAVVAPALRRILKLSWSRTSVVTLLITGTAVNCLLAGDHIQTAYAESQPFRPFWTFAYNPDFFDVQQWAKRNTNIQTVFLILVNPRDNSDRQLMSAGTEDWRNNSERDIYLNSITFLYNEGPSAYLEWKRRKTVAEAVITALGRLDFAAAHSVLIGEPIDYIILPGSMSWPDSRTVYSNPRYQVIALPK